MKQLPENITIQQVKSALSSELLAELAHQKFLPKGRSLEIPKNQNSTIKESAVIVLLILKNNEIHLCLTRRNSNLKHHPGQISFPGGKIDKAEDDSVKTALRELEEETGVDQKSVTICGILSDLYVSVSNFLIHPVVGFLDHVPHFIPNHHEVEEIMLIPLNAFFNTKHLSESTVETSFGKIDVPCYTINKQVIWGATAMILSEFTELLSMFYYRQE